MNVVTALCTGVHKHCTGHHPHIIPSNQLK